MQFLARSLLIHPNRQIAYQVYQTAMSQNSVVVVFLHGLGSSGAAWNKIIDALAQFENLPTIITIDCLGHGLSSRPSQTAAYDFDLLAEDITAVIQRVTRGPAILIGHCLGSLLAQLVTAKNPQLVQKMILINTTSVGTVGIFKLLWLVYPLLRLISLVLPTLHRSGRYDYAGFDHTADINLVRIVYDLVFTSLKSYLVCGLNAMRFKTPQALYHVPVPALIIAGQMDSIYPSWSGQTLARQLKQASFTELAGVNHISPINGWVQLSQIFTRELGLSAKS